MLMMCFCALLTYNLPTTGMLTFPLVRLFKQPLSLYRRAEDSLRRWHPPDSFPE